MDVRYLAGGFGLALMLLTGARTAESAARPIRIFAAGSLGTVLSDLIAASGLPAEDVAPPVFGPSGLLRQRLIAGEAADLFASADPAQLQAVA